MANYQHSESFASLKNIKEDVSENFTSFQWLTVLDFFLSKAFEQMDAGYPELVNNFLAKIVAWQTNKPGIKISRTPKAGLPCLLFNALTHPPSRDTCIKNMLLNRGITFGLMSVFSNTVNKFGQVHSNQSCLSDERRISAIFKFQTRVPTLTHAHVTDFKYWSRKAYWFKELIIQKYVRLALVQAQHTYKEIDHAVPLDDIVQVYLTYLSKAIDRCDSRQGVLTTFISTWFYSARSTVKGSVKFDYDYDEASQYSVLPYDELSSDIEARQHIAYLAKSLDPDGVARYALGIPEFVPLPKQQILKLFTHPSWSK